MDEIDKLKIAQRDAEVLNELTSAINDTGNPYDGIEGVARINMFVDTYGKVTDEENLVIGYTAGNKRSLVALITLVIEECDIVDDVYAMLMEEKRTFDSVIAKANKAINKK